MSARAALALPLAAEPMRPGVWRVASSRPDEPPYEVGYRGAGGSCTCPGYQRWHHCRHLDYVRTLAGPAPAPRKERAMQTNPRALQRVEPQALAIEEPSRELTNLSIADIRVMSELLTGATGFLPKGVTTPGQVFAVILTGQEIGLGPMASLRHIPLVEGKADPDAELLLALIRHRYGPETIRVAEANAEHATVEWRQPGWPGIQSFTWTRADSERAGLAGKDNHRKYPAAMNRSRAVKHVARSAFPEVALGLDLGGEEAAGDAPIARLVDGARARSAETEAPRDGLLTAEDLQAGGPDTGERGGIVGEILEAECAVCGRRGECLDDGEAYVCRDQGACASRCLTREEQPAPAPAETPGSAGLANAKQLETLRAHLTRTGRTEASLVAEVGALEELTRAEASQLIRELGRVPNATPEEVAF